MSKCPYCESDELTVVEITRKRHPQHTTVHCGNCNSFSVKHKNGRVYPLADKSNRESDAVAQSR